MSESREEIANSTPQETVHALDRALMAGDVDGIVALYDEQAFVVPQPGAEARGTDAIRALYAEFVKLGAKIEQHVERVLEADGIALYLSRWTSTLPNGQSQEAVATVVLRQQAGGGWKVVIDSAQGPALLDAGQA